MISGLPISTFFFGGVMVPWCQEIKENNDGKFLVFNQKVYPRNETGGLEKIFPTSHVKRTWYDLPVWTALLMT